MSDHSQPEASLNKDVQIIRNILLGEHFEEFQARIDALEKEVSSLQREKKKLQKALEAETENRETALQAEAGSRINALQVERQHLEKAQIEFKDQVTRFEKLLESDRNGYKKSLDEACGELLDHIKSLESRLSLHENKETGLISSLASALKSYKEQSE